MSMRALLPVVAVAFCAAARPSYAELSIEGTKFGCIVAGQFPKLSACFTPASELARGRIYFRGEGGTHWYFVEMKPEAPCHIGVLPKPKKSLKRMDVYFEGVDKAFAERRTADASLDIVPSEAACRKGLAAPFLNKATVVVGTAAGAPALPTGFLASGIAGAGGVSAAVIVVPVVVAAGGATAVVAGRDSGSATTTLAVTPPTTQAAPPTTTAAPPPQPPPTTQPPASNRAPNLVCNVSPDPAEGFAPLDVGFKLCQSSDPDGDPLFFDFIFGDGGTSGGRTCSVTHTYAAGTYRARACVTDGVLASHRQCCNVDVNAKAKRDPTPGPYYLGATERVTLMSRLAVPSATGQMVFNGSVGFFPGVGLAHAVAPARRGENRVEAQLIEAKGAPGTWRFDLEGDRFEEGSLRVLAGDTALVAPSAIVFRLKGIAGERVVFTFRQARY